MPRGPKPKDKIICPRCNRKAQPVRGYCKNCATTLVQTGKLAKIQVDDTPPQLTSIQKEILCGLMLGDGCLYRRKETHTPYLVVGRSRTDKDYLVENYEYFKDYCKRGVIDSETFDERTNKTYCHSRFVTRRCKVFVPYYEQWYPEGIKRIPLEIELTPLTMAIWFADDGNVRSCHSLHRLRMKLSTHGFCLEDTVRLKQMLEGKCNERFGISRTEGYITASDAGTRAFLKIIDEYLPVSMERKAYWRNPEARFYDNIPKRMNPDVGKHHEYEFHRD